MAVRSWNMTLILLLALQVIWWFGLPIPQDDDSADSVWLNGTRSIRPTMHTVPPVPTEQAALALGLGDAQWFFRIGAFRLQNAGDGFGQVTPLKNYNYEQLFRWWTLLDALDPRSSFVPATAAYYFGATQNPREQVPYVVRYLVEHSDKNPVANWWWYHQASYLARHRLKDADWALEIAYKLANLPEDADVPLWTRQLPAFILEKQGEYAQACQIILDILDSKDDLTPHEINFILHFINDRIAKLAEADTSTQASVDPRCYHLARTVAERRTK